MSHHLTDDDLVLHYYGEGGPRTLAVERHLQSCAPCAQAYDVLTRTLRAVTPPDLVDAPDDTLALRELLRAKVRGAGSVTAARLPWWRSEPGAIALAWLMPVLYPWSLPALFRSAQWAQHEIAGMALSVVMLLWACAGPVAAMLALHGVGDRFDRVPTRLRVLGATFAAVSPALFFMLMRGGQRLEAWYLVLGASVLLALVQWPALPAPTVRLRLVHRLSAAVLGLFILSHIVNQSLAFISVPWYAAMRNVMQAASQQSISYTVIAGAAALQIVTGMTMSFKNVRAGAFARNLQAVSGLYLAVFLLTHVFGGYLFSRPAGVAPVAASLVPPYLLGNGRAVAQLPYYLLGVAAFLVHVGVYARLAALVYFAESSVRRLSYAAAFAGAMVVVTVGLSLCGIHLLP